MSSAIVSHEVVARIHRDQVRMLVIAAELERAAEQLRDDRLVRLAGSLASALRDHLSLVEGVLDAVSTDEPAPLAIRPTIRGG